MYWVFLCYEMSLFMKKILYAEGILKNVLSWLIYSIHIILLHLKWYNLILDKIYPDFIKHSLLQNTQEVKKKKHSWTTVYF